MKNGQNILVNTLDEMGSYLGMAAPCVSQWSINGETWFWRIIRGSGFTGNPDGHIFDTLAAAVAATDQD